MTEQISLLFWDWKGFKVTVIFSIKCNVECPIYIIIIIIIVIDIDILKLKTFCRMYLDRSQEDKLPLMLQHVFIFIYQDSTI